MTQCSFCFAEATGHRTYFDLDRVYQLCDYHTKDIMSPELEDETARLIYMEEWLKRIKWSVNHDKQR